MAAEDSVADGVDAAVEAVQAAASNQPRDRRVVKPQVVELRAAYDTVPAAGESRQTSTWGC
jgi:hypothetical protein